MVTLNFSCESIKHAHKITKSMGEFAACPVISPSQAGDWNVSTFLIPKQRELKDKRELIVYSIPKKTFMQLYRKSAYDVSYNWNCKRIRAGSESAKKMAKEQFIFNGTIFPAYLNFPAVSVSTTGTENITIPIVYLNEEQFPVRSWCSCKIEPVTNHRARIQMQLHTVMTKSYLDDKLQETPEELLKNVDFDGELLCFSVLKLNLFDDIASVSDMNYFQKNSPLLNSFPLTSVIKHTAKLL